MNWNAENLIPVIISSLETSCLRPISSGRRKLIRTDDNDIKGKTLERAERRFDCEIQIMMELHSKLILYSVHSINIYPYLKYYKP